MANEVLYSGLADLSLSEVLSQEVQLLLADRNALGAHPALHYAGDLAGSTSATFQVGQVGWLGYDILADGAENTDPGNTALTDSSYTITVARKTKVYRVSDLASITKAENGIFVDPARLAADAIISRDMKLTDMIAQIGDGFTTTVGPGTGVNLDLASILEARATLEIANVPGPYLCVLHPRQWADLVSDLTTATGGAVQFSDFAQNMINAAQLGYKGNYLGIDFFVSSKVPTANAGADRAGFMCGAGAIGWADSSIPVDPIFGGNFLIADKVKIEFERDSVKAMKHVVFDAYLGASLALDSAGVTIISDA